MSSDLAVPASLEGNWLAVRERLARAARRAGRDPSAIRLVAVTKSAPPERALELVRLGQVELGESRADALVGKSGALAAAGAAPRWHFLGHLQRNKARRVLERADVIHSVDSVPLLATLARLSAECGRSPELFVQVELGAAATRTGLAPAALDGLLEAARAFPGLRLAGLMTIAPLAPAGDAGSARSAFRALARLARAIEADPARAALFAGGRVRLSMGMSDDFELAVEEGSDLVRVGSALFEGLEHDAVGSDAA